MPFIGRLLTPALVIAVVLLLVQQVQIPGSSHLLRAINNAGHVPLFGIVSVALLYLVRWTWPRHSSWPLVYYIAAFVLSVALGVASESLQYFGPRDADLGDLARDVVGAATFLALHATFDRHLFGKHFDRRRTTRRWLRYLSVAILLVTLTPPVYWAMATYERNRRFPVICAFDSMLLRAFVQTKDARLVAVDGRFGAMPGMAPKRFRRLIFLEGTYPGFSIEDIYQDWRGYDSLVLVFYAPESAPSRLGLRVDDRQHEGLYTDRFNTRVPVHPGVNRFAVPLADVRSAPRTRTMDLANIAAIHLFGDSTAVGREILMQEMRLE
jgi:hypothetical protein